MEEPRRAKGKTLTDVRLASQSLTSGARELAPPLHILVQQQPHSDFPAKSETKDLE